MIFDKTTQKRYMYHARIAAGFSIRELGNYTGIHRNILSEIERGRINPTLDELSLIAKALKVENVLDLEKQVELIIKS